MLNQLRISAMKKLFIFLFLVPLTAAAQATKTEEIFNSGNCILSCMGTFNNDTLVSAYVTFDAKDDRLATLKNYFTLCYDTPQNVFKFLNELEKFSADNALTSTEIGRHKIEIDKSTGTKTVKVYDERGMIFHRFPQKLITSIKANLGEWASKNNIKLD
jgi:hypothetical protein